MTDEFEELESVFTEEQNIIEPTKYSVVDSLKEFDNLDKGIQRMSEKDRIYLAEYFRKHGVAGNEILESLFRLVLSSGEILTDMEQVRVNHINNLNNATTDIIASQINSLEQFKSETIAEIKEELNIAIEDGKQMNIDLLERNIDTQKQLQLAYEDMLKSTITMTDIYHKNIYDGTKAVMKQINDATGAIMREVGSSHDLTLIVATEMATRVLDKNSDIFKNKMAEVLKQNKKEYDSIITRFDHKKMFKQIFINSISYFVAGAGLLIAYPIIKAFF